MILGIVACSVVMLNPTFFTSKGQGYMLTSGNPIPVRGDVEHWFWSPSGRWLLIMSKVFHSEPTNRSYEAQIHSVWDTQNQTITEIADLRAYGNIAHQWDPFDRCLLGWTDTVSGILLRRWEYGTWRESLVMRSRPGVESYRTTVSGFECLIEVNANNARIYDTGSRNISEHQFPHDYQAVSHQMTDPDKLMLTDSNNRHFGLLYSMSSRQFTKISLVDIPYKPRSFHEPFLVRRTPSGEMALIEHPGFSALALVGFNENYWVSAISPTARHVVRLSKGTLYINSIVPVAQSWVETLGDAYQEPSPKADQ